MLQQTQVDRVIPKYQAFLKAFPTLRALADAPLGSVLSLWSGLGYNRRARMLHESACMVRDFHHGRLPKTVQELEQLPGIGPYTARAVAAFAHNTPVVMLETNIRAVYLHTFFPERDDVADAELIPYIEQTLDIENPREWYAALMDYGTYIKKLHPNPSRKSAHHVQQAPFKGSLREVRGAVLRAVLTTPHTLSDLEHSRFTSARIEEALEGLSRDGLIVKRGSHWHPA